nr:MAG TPA: hypothetical protein [Caudoviricetes sp.]
MNLIEESFPIYIFINLLYKGVRHEQNHSYPFGRSSINWRRLRLRKSHV